MTLQSPNLDLSDTTTGKRVNTKVYVFKVVDWSAPGRRLVSNTPRVLNKPWIRECENLHLVLRSVQVDLSWRVFYKIQVRSLDCQSRLGFLLSVAVKKPGNWGSWTSEMASVPGARGGGSKQMSRRAKQRAILGTSLSYRIVKRNTRFYLCARRSIFAAFAVPARNSTENRAKLERPGFPRISRPQPTCWSWSPLRSATVICRKGEDLEEVDFVSLLEVTKNSVS